MMPLLQRALVRVLILCAALGGAPAFAQFGVPAPNTPAVNTVCPTFAGFPLTLNLGSPGLLGLDGVTSRCGFNQVQQALNTRGQPNGLASLDANGLLPATQLPPISLTLPNGGSISALTVTGALTIGGTGSTGAVDAMNVTLFPGTPRTLVQRAGDRVTIEDLGGGTGATPTQNCNALNDARAHNLTIHLGDGTYQTNCTVLLTPYDGAGHTGGLAGNGSNRTVLMNTTADQPTIKLPAYAQGSNVVGLKLDRSVTPTNTGDGLVALDNSSGVLLQDINSTHNYNGFNLGITDVATVLDTQAKSNTANGYFFQNGDNTTAGNKPLQWNFSGRTLSASNGQDGFRVQANAGSLAAGGSQLVMGQWDNLSTYGNAEFGAAFFGATNLPIHDVRITNPFMGEDGQTEIYLDTYGHSHFINGGFLELPGTFLIYASGNNTSLNITGTHFASPKRNAIFSAAANTSVSGITVENGGQDATASATDRAVVSLAGNDSIISGGVLSGGTYGVIINGARGAVIGTRILNTTTAATSLQTDTTVRGVRGVTDAN